MHACICGSVHLQRAYKVSQPYLPACTTSFSLNRSFNEQVLGRRTKDIKHLVSPDCRHTHALLGRMMRGGQTCNIHPPDWASLLTLCVCVCVCGVCVCVCVFTGSSGITISRHTCKKVTWITQRCSSYRNFKILCGMKRDFIFLPLQRV